VGSMSETPNAWAFLHARNREVDYSFALLPAFLIRNKDVQSRLGRQLSGDPGESGDAELRIGDTKYVVHFTVENARIDGENARDPAGRLITLSRGVICHHAVRKEELRSLGKELVAEVDDAWKRFWRDGRRPIIASKDRFLNTEAPEPPVAVAPTQPREVIVMPKWYRQRPSLVDAALFLICLGLWLMTLGGLGKLEAEVNGLKPPAEGNPETRMNGLKPRAEGNKPDPAPTPDRQKKR
jgi:hypothetical protein